MITKDKLKQSLQEEKNNYKKMYEDNNEEPYESEHYRDPLEISKTTEIKVLLSWGGGEDGFKFYVKDKEIVRAVYYMADWGEYEEIELTTEETEMFADLYFIDSVVEE